MNNRSFSSRLSWRIIGIVSVIFLASFAVIGIATQYVVALKYFDFNYIIKINISMKLNNPFVITISREVGSGGNTVGQKLAEKLGVCYVNKQIIQALEEKFNLTSSSIEHLKSTKKNWFTDMFEQVTPAAKSTITVGGYTYSRHFQEAVTVKDIFEAEKEILNAIADEW